MIIIDTDILVWILRGKTEIKDQFEKLNKETHGLLYITPIQISEIYSGVREEEKDVTDIFLDSFEVVSITKEMGKIAGIYINRYKKSHGVTIADALIASAVNSFGYSLWTMNTKHYPMIMERDFISVTKLGGMRPRE